MPPGCRRGYTDANRSEYAAAPGKDPMAPTRGRSAGGS